MKVIFGRQSQQPPSLFSGDAWINAAEYWAAGEGDLVISRFTVDQRFQVGHQWYRIDWTGEEWVVKPVEGSP